MASMLKRPRCSARGMCVVINLERRMDRRRWMELTCANALRASGAEVEFLRATEQNELRIEDDTVVSGISSRFRTLSGWELGPEGLDATAARWERIMEKPVDRTELERYYGRCMNMAEVACYVSHHRAWEILLSRADLEYMLILEDDAVACNSAPQPLDVHRLSWACIWKHIEQYAAELERTRHGWDLLYLGRNRFGADRAASADLCSIGEALGCPLVLSGFASCAHAYVITRSGASRLVQRAGNDAPPLMPVDDLLPALYSEHPRRDIHELLMSFRADRFVAYALSEDRVWQLESLELDPREELIIGSSPLFACDLAASDIADCDVLMPSKSLAASTSDSLGASSETMKAFIAKCQANGIPLQLPISDLEAHRARTISLHTLDVLVLLLIFSFLPDRSHVSVASTCKLLGAVIRAEQLWRMAVLSKVLPVVPEEPSVTFTCCWRQMGTVLHNARELPGACSRCGVRATSLEPHLSAKLDRIVAVCDVLRSEEGLHGVRHVLTSSVEAMPVSRFLREHDRASRPLLLMNAAAGHFTDELASWKLEALLQRLGKHDFRCVAQSMDDVRDCVRMTLQDYVHYMRCGQDEDALYLFDHVLPPGLVALCKCMPYFEEDFLTDLSRQDELFSTSSVSDGSAVWPDMLTERQWLVIGPAGSGSRIHFDPYATSAYNVLLHGTKLWWLFPPTKDATGDPRPPGVDLVRGNGVHADLFKCPAAATWFSENVVPFVESGSATPCGLGDSLWAIQREGDVVFVPHGWWHCVLNLTETVAYTQNFVNRVNVREAAAELEEMHPDISARLARAAWEAHT